MRRRTTDTFAPTHSPYRRPHRAEAVALPGPRMRTRRPAPRARAARPAAHAVPRHDSALRATRLVGDLAVLLAAVLAGAVVLSLGGADLPIADRWLDAANVLALGLSTPVAHALAAPAYLLVAAVVGGRVDRAPRG